MFCAQCRAELPEGSQFCSKCGHAINFSPKPDSAAFKTGRAAGRRPFLVIVLVGLTIIVFMVLIQPVEPHNPTMRGTMPFQIGSQQRTLTIIDTALTIKNASYSYYKFTVPDGASNVWVDGHFSATGGSGNDIEVYLMDEDAFANWQNNHSTPISYNAGRLTQGKIYATLPARADTYYLVFSNAFSLLTPKAVQASATLHYVE